MPEKAILQGDLRKIQLPDVLSFMAMIRESGKLQLVNKDLERTIHWKEGEIVFASSNSPEHSLGQFLLRNGKITREEGVQLVRKFDHEFPKKYFKDFLEYISLTADEFHATVDKFRSPHLWEKRSGDWRLRHAVWYPEDGG